MSGRALSVGIGLVLALGCVATAHAAPADLDSTFGGGDGIVVTDFDPPAADVLQVMEFQPDGKLLAGGYSSTAPGGQRDDDLAIARYLPDGSLDTSFGGDGTVTTEIGGRESLGYLFPQDDGKILAAGSVYFPDTDQKYFLFLRYNADGSLDTTFGDHGIRTFQIPPPPKRPAYLGAIGIQPDGKIILTGTVYGPDDMDIVVARLDTDGTLDTSFSGDGMQFTDMGFDDSVDRVLIQPDGKIVVFGDASGSSFSYVAAARYLPDGSLDSTFGTGGLMRVGESVVGRYTQVQDGLLQDDGRIVGVGEGFHPNPNGDDFSVVRITADGQPDTSFAGDGGEWVDFGPDHNAGALAVAVQPGGEIVAAGSAETYPTEADAAVVRFSPNGTVDTSFAPGGKRWFSIYDDWDRSQTILLQDDGKILLGGENEDDFVLMRLEGGPDTATPQTVITAGPANDATLETSSVEFAFQTPDGVSFECSMDATAYSACDSPRSYADLADGRHTFSVRAVDATGHADPTPATRAFTIATPPPDPETRETPPWAVFVTPPTVQDDPPPTLLLDGETRQLAGSPIRLDARCSEDCIVEATGTVVTRDRRSLDLKPARAELRASQWAPLQLTMRRHERRALFKSLGGRKSARARISIVATDGSGNQSSSKFSVKLTSGPVDDR